MEPARDRATPRAAHSKALDDNLNKTNLDIQAILFDADGVLQRPAALRPQAWQRLLGPDRDAGQFVHAVFDVEEAALDGGCDFIGALSALCATGIATARWRMLSPCGR